MKWRKSGPPSISKSLVKRHRLSSELRDLHPDIPWTDVIAMRNVIVHHYFGIDPQQIWDTVVNDLVPLKRIIEDILGRPGDRGQ